MELGDSGVLAVQPGTSRLDTRVDGDVVSRFATCCRALGIAVYQRQRPADLAAARSGFTALTRVAHDQCDAWTGLAAAGDASFRVLEAVSRTAATSGVLQRQADLAPAPSASATTAGSIYNFEPPTPTSSISLSRLPWQRPDSLPRPTRSSRVLPRAAQAGAKRGGSPSSSTTAPSGGPTSSSC